MTDLETRRRAALEALARRGGASISRFSRETQPSGNLPVDPGSAARFLEMKNRLEDWEDEEYNDEDPATHPLDCDCFLCIPGA